MLASAKHERRDGSGLLLVLAAGAGIVVVLGIGALVDVDWDWGRQSLSVVGAILALAGVLGTTIVLGLAASTRRDREATNRLVQENEELQSRAQRTLARREAKSRKGTTVGQSSASS